MTVEFVVLLAVRVALLAATGTIACAARRSGSAPERHLLWMLTLSAILFLPVAIIGLPSIPLTWMRFSSDGERIAAHAVESAGGPSSISFWIAAVWIAGILARLLRVSLAHIRAQRTVGRAKVSDSMARIIGVPVRLSDDVRFAFSYGLRRPVVVLPSDAVTWTYEQLRATLLHEAAHIARHDCASLFASQCAIALYWWHPAVWFVTRKADAERERACDDAVVRGGVRPSEYGSHLLTHATRSRSPMRLVAPALLTTDDGLAARISNILDTRVDRRRVGARRALLTCACAAPVVVFVGAASPPRENSAARQTLRPLFAIAAPAGIAPAAAAQPLAQAPPRAKKSTTHLVPRPAESSTPDSINGGVARTFTADADSAFDAPGDRKNLAKTTEPMAYRANDMAHVATQMARLAGRFARSLNAASAPPTRGATGADSIPRLP